MQLKWTIHASDVRDFCVRHGYYKNGTNAEYEHLLSKLCPIAQTSGRLEDLWAIASDILNHSDRKRLLEQYGCTNMELESNMVCQLLNDCCYFFPEKAKEDSVYAEVRCTHFDTVEELWCVDAWKTDDDAEEGKVVATIDLAEGQVLYKTEEAVEDAYVQEIIDEFLKTGMVLTE